MRYKGESFHCEESYQVLDATISKTNISIDYVDNGGTGLVSAKSDDGNIFMGTYGYPGINGSRILGKIDLELFKGTKGRVLLVAHWSDDYTGNEGIWIFKLSKGSS